LRTLFFRAILEKVYYLYTKLLNDVLISAADFDSYQKGIDFMVNRGKILTHKEILKTVWGAAHGDDTTYLRVYIGQIREKIEENPTLPVFITTEPGRLPHGSLPARRF